MGNRNGRGRDRDRVQQTETPVIKNHNNIKKETIKLVNCGENKYYLDFTFSCTYDCIITIYLCSTEYRNSDDNGPPVYFYTPDYVPEKPTSYKFSAGTKQVFPRKAFILDVNRFKEEDLVHYKEDQYYPIVITIETDYPEVIAEDNKNYAKNKRQAQLTYGYFNRNSREEFVFMLVKQCFLFRNKLFKIEDIFGHERNTDGENDAFDDSQRECVVCYSTMKDTLVYPCRHICLCAQCTQVVRMQNSKCPICRRPAEKFMNIKIEGVQDQEPELDMDNTRINQQNMENDNMHV